MVALPILVVGLPCTPQLLVGLRVGAVLVLPALVSELPCTPQLLLGLQVVAVLVLPALVSELPCSPQLLVGLEVAAHPMPVALWGWVGVGHGSHTCDGGRGGGSY